MEIKQKGGIMQEMCLCGMWEIEEYGPTCPSCEIEIERAEEGLLEDQILRYLGFLDEVEVQKREARVARIRSWTDQS
jgi:hypothetical protein